jgi:hypothetical protein
MPNEARRVILRRDFPWRCIAILTLGFLAAGAAITPARASIIGLGVISFVTVSPGVDGFEIDNYTGSQAVPPDLPVVTDLIFTDLTLTYFANGTKFDNAVPDVAPGTTIAFTLPDTTSVDWASLSGLLNSSAFLLADGTSWQAESNALSVELLPENGEAVTADLDSAEITVEADPTVPEPAAGLLVVAGLGLIVLRSRLSQGDR